MSTSNQQKPQGTGAPQDPNAGDVERTQKVPRIEKPASARTSTGASPATRPVAGSGDQPTEAKSGSDAPASGNTEKPSSGSQNGQPAAKKSSAKKASASKSAQTVGQKLASRAAAEQAATKQSESAKAAPAKDASTDTTDKPADDKPVDEKKTDEKAGEEKVEQKPAKKSAKKATKASASAKKATEAPAKAKDDTAARAADREPAPAGAGAKDSPMTARDYARTTRESVDSTSVIPAVRDEPAPAAAPAPVAEESTAGRSARLRLVHVEPWSVTRLAFVVSVAMMIVAVVAVAIFWLVLDLAGVWDSLNGTITNVLSDGETGFDLTDYLGIGRLMGLTLLLSAINVIVMTMMATIAAHLYNYAAQLIGGVDVTFADK